MTINSILDFIKEILLKPTLLFAAWFVGALLLFVPSKYLDYLALTWFRDEYRKWIGPATLVAFAAWVSQVAAQHLWPWIQFKKWSWKSKLESLKHVNSLSPDKLAVLLFCLSRDQRTIVLPCYDPVASSLRTKGLLEPARDGTLFQYPHTIPAHVWTNLQSRREELLPADHDALEELRRAVEDRFGE